MIPSVDMTNNLILLRILFSFVTVYRRIFKHFVLVLNFIKSFLPQIVLNQFLYLYAKVPTENAIFMHFPIKLDRKADK